MKLVNLVSFDLFSRDILLSANDVELWLALYEP